MDRGILVRTATPRDSEDFGSLVLLSGPSLFPMVLGVNAKSIIESLFGHPRTLFSLEHAHFIEVDGRNAGMILSYDWRAQKQEQLKTGFLLLTHMKAWLLAQLPLLLRANSVLSRVGTNEYYVSNVAVYPEYRGLGFGTRLLEKVEDEASRLGADRIVLDVEVDNRDAIRLYGKVGYGIVRKPRELVGSSETLSFFRMSKAIPGFPTQDSAG